MVTPRFTPRIRSPHPIVGGRLGARYAGKPGAVARPNALHAPLRADSFDAEVRDPAAISPSGEI